MNWQFYFPEKIVNGYHILYAGRYDDYEYVDRLFFEAIAAVGSRNLQRVFNYMAPKLREKGLDPRKWISWIFRKRIL